MVIGGSCHCGNISFRLEWPQDAAQIPARACTCSFCSKHGGVWTSHAGAALVIHVTSAELVSRYTFGTGTATFHVCRRCGVVPVVTCELDTHLYAVVNVNAFQDVEPSLLRRSAAEFAGEDLDARLERRKRNWIASVRIVEAAP